MRTALSKAGAIARRAAGLVVGLMAGLARRSPVLTCALAAFAVTLPLAWPSVTLADYAAGIDVRTLAMLWCLLVIVGGLRSRGVMRFLGLRLARHARSTRTLVTTLVVLTFFWSMLITNDVALLVFVPLTLVLLNEVDARKSAAAAIVLEAAAANVGSALSPLGNPQNIFLQSFYGIRLSEFLSTLWPIVAAGFVLLLAGCFLLVRPQAVRLSASDGGAGGNDTSSDADSDGGSGNADRTATPKHRALDLVILFALLIVALSCSAHLVDARILLAATSLGALARFRDEARRADYALLATFLAFFLFVVNIQHIPALRAWLEATLASSPLLLAALTSQVISNVPAAVTLAGFTDHATALLLGCNIGGLGTPVASLASLIALRFYRAWAPRDFGRCLKLFAVVNAVGLAVLLGLGMGLGAGTMAVVSW